MSDIESIFYILAALTVAFGMIWIRPGGVLFASALGERHRLHWLAGRSLITNERGGLLLGNLIPLGSSFTAAPWPLEVSPSGVLAHSLTAPTPDGKPDDSDDFVSFADLRSAECEGTALLINGKRFLTFQSKSACRRWASWLLELRDLPEADRGPLIEQAIAQSCDIAAAERDIAACRRQTRLLRWVSTILFLYCFVILGLVAFAEVTLSLRRAFLAYAGLVMLIYLLCLRAERALFAPSQPAGGHGWLMFVSPVDAFRAADHLFRQTLEIYHPLALSRCLVSPASHDNFARRVVRDLHFPLPDATPSTDLRVNATVTWFGERLQRALLGIIHDPQRHLVPPPPDDEWAIAYCPRCDGQFVRNTGTCTACGVALREFVKES